MTDTTPTQTTPTITFQEAPASWNTRYVDPAGFDCQLTLRDTSGSALLKKAGAALKALIDDGCTPYYPKYNGGNGNSAVAASKPAEAPKLADGSVDPAWCAVHGVAMSRHEKDGQVWYSHKDGENYCKGKAKK
jgi:hypothetical protein